ncbi:MAG: hypothetical protein IH804_02510, partial [Planctomycetes bacterium]|nr:hypothetical protein [Planctomycetota bacterium]
MRHTPLESGSRIDRLGMVGGPLLVIALMGVLSGWTGAGRGHAGLEAAWVLLRALPWALGWLVAAIGFGWPLRRLLAGDGRAGFAIQVGLGVAGLLILDAALGALGVLQIGGSLGAWLLLVAGLALAAEQARRWYTGDDRPLPYVPWPVWTAAPAVAVLLIAACSAPGWLWASEFGGYDALSYHLQLPKEWLAAGRIEPLEHNVYSFLPGYVEAAYYHLAVLIGDGVEAVYACQVLHGGFTLLTAALVGRAAARHGGRVAGSVAAVIVVGTPWVVVVGSLAYNEMVVALLLAAGLLVVEETGLSPGRRGAAVGLIAAAACGSKLTAVGFVAVPLGLLLLGLSHPRRWLWIAACAGVAGLVGLLKRPATGGHGVALLLFFAFARTDYRVTAKTLLEGEIQRSAVAPFDGFIRSAPLRAGDVVSEGDTLCVLDDRDLRLEKLKWSSQYDQFLQQYHQASAQREPPR